MSADGKEARGPPEDHGAFDSHYLRLRAVNLPWHTRPKLPETSFTVEDFCRWAHTRFVSTLKPGEQSCLRGQDLGMRKKLLRHWLSVVVREGVFCHMGRHGSEGIVKVIRWQCEEVMAEKRYPLREGDLLYNKGYGGEPGETPSGEPCKWMRATVEDRHFAAWFRGDPLERFIHEGVPELTTLSPDCPLEHHAVELRRDLRGLIAGSEELSDDSRSQCLEKIADELDAMTPSDVQAEIDAVAEEIGVGDILNAETASVAAKLCILGLSDVAAEAHIRPALEQLTVARALEKDDEGLEILAGVWRRLLHHHGIPICDRPSLGVALLAIGITSVPPRDTLKHL